MALTTIQSNNKLVQYTKDINYEFVRQNLFSPYMSSDLNAIIRTNMTPKQGGEQMNLPLVTRLTNSAVGAGTLVGNEEKIDNYGMRMWVDWARNAVTTNKAESQKDSADIFGQAKPLLSDWGKSLQRDELIEALMALPSESAPANLGTSAGQRVNGLKYESATAGQRNTWTSDNSDRVLFGLTANYSATHATGLTNIVNTVTLKTSSISLMKRIAMSASPAIRPYRTEDGYEWYVCFAGVNTFRDLKSDIATYWQYAEPREKMDGNPLFQSGDITFDGVIIRQVPEISGFVTDVWSAMKTGGASSNRIEPVFFCGQQAATLAWGQMAQPTFRKEDDYGFITGTGVEMCYGTAKMFKKHPSTGTALVQWGVLSGFFSAATD